MNKNILHVVHRLTCGGAERVLVNYLNGSNSHNHAIVSFLPADSFSNELKRQDIEVINLHKRNGNDIAIPFKLGKICRDLNIDIVHCQGWGTYLESLLCSKFLRRNIKFAFAFHGKTLSDLKPPPLRRVITQRIGAKIGDGIITPSDCMRIDYATSIGISEKYITVIYNGVDTDLFLPAGDQKEIRKELGFDESDIVLGCIARLDPIKNISGLIKAFAECRKRNSGLPLKLLIVGDGPELKKLQTTADESGQGSDIFFTGLRSDIPACLQSMDFYVQASFYEGFSMTTLEAMSCALPVIAFDVGGTKEMIQNGQNGMLLDHRPEKSEILAQEISRLSLDKQLRLELGKNARATIERHFSIAVMNKKYDQYFAEL